jgi:hypothetical protein
VGVFIQVMRCSCCGGNHDDVELFGGWIPPHVKVWRNLEHDDRSCWYLCPVFGYAVLISLSRVGPGKKA